jgi:ABC-type bacteriocin/lantibiotic exporter with double-glycine peptidase domain
MLVNHAGEIIVVLVGSQFVAKDMLTLGTFLMFIIYLQRLIEPIWTLSWFYASSKQVFRYIDRLKETEMVCSPVDDSGQTKDVGRFKSLVFEDVSFAFPDGNSDVLSGISLKLLAGEKLAITGRVGAGKTTLLELVQRNLIPVSAQFILMITRYRSFAQVKSQDLLAMSGKKAFFFQGR